MVVAVTGLSTIACDTRLECARAKVCFFLFFLNVHQCVCVCELRLLSHAESLDVSGQFMCDSDEPCGGDGLSVIWLTEQ